MDYTNHYDILQSLQYQAQHQLFMLWEGRKYNKGNLEYDGHRGWFESHQLSTPKTGHRSDARRHELINNRHIPIKQIHINDCGEKKYFYALGCSPSLIDWKEILTNWKKWKFR